LIHFYKRKIVFNMKIRLCINFFSKVIFALLVLTVTVRFVKYNADRSVVDVSLEQDKLTSEMSLSGRKTDITAKQVKSSDQQILEPHPHHDLYTRNLTLINITNFKFIINNDICNVTPIALVTIVHTALGNKEARDIIRTTWGSASVPEATFKLVFLLGATAEQELQSSIAKENDQHQDMVQGDFLDTYRNLSYKNIMGNLWVSQFCEQANFVVKTDDDQYVDLYEVLVLTRRYYNSLEYIKDRFLLCPVLRGNPILRDPGIKWFVSDGEIPTEVEFYPNHCTGWLHIASPGTSRALAEAATRVSFFWIDDAWVTGYIARHLNITHLDIVDLWSIPKEKLLLSKSVQNPAIYQKDFLSGPMERDLALSQALHRRATWCHVNSCFNNIYQENSPVNISQEVNFNLINKLFPF
jgi:hypothetical protein